MNNPTTSKEPVLSLSKDPSLTADTTSTPLHSAQDDKYTLVTGASSGIGFEFAHVFAKHNHNLILVARSEEKLNKLAEELQNRHNIQVQVIAQDLSKQHAAQKLFDTVQSKQLSVDILVNNAGFGDYSEFADENIEIIETMMMLNMNNLTLLTRLFLPEMKKRKKGSILNVASTAAFEPGPYMAVYFATKAYVLNISEAINAELAGTGVHVSTLCPGPTKTGFESRASDESISIFKGDIMDARKVAEIGYHGMMNKKMLIIPGIKNKILTLLPRFFPRKWVVGIVKSMLQR